jgi:hypothetical protein
LENEWWKSLKLANFLQYFPTIIQKYVLNLICINLVFYILYVI